MDKLHKALGLSEEEVKNSRASFGRNVLEEIKPTSIVVLLLDSIKQPMMLLLLSIAGLSLFFGKIAEAIVMIFVVGAYISVELINKYRSDKVLTRLKELTQPETKVLRNGILQTIPIADVVVSDIVILSEGVRIPADLQLVETFGLLIDESSVTGESNPVLKKVEDTLLSGTLVIAGEGVGKVIAVGKDSNLGIIANQVQLQQKEKTLVQNAMAKLVKVLASIALIVSLIIPFIGFLRGLNPQEMLLTGLSLTFLMIPGQPPIIITMALAIASFELSNIKLIVKHLRGVEILGQTDSIVTDKTGTITESTMKVNHFILPSGDEPSSLSQELKEKIALCLPKYSQDPTDKAILDAIGIENKSTYEKLINFSAKEPWRSIFYKGFVAIAGQPELLIARSPLSDLEKENLLNKISQQTKLGNRVVGLAINLNLGFLPSESTKIYDEIDHLSTKRIAEGAILERKDDQDRVKIVDSEQIKPKVL